MGLFNNINGKIGELKIAGKLEFGSLFGLDGRVLSNIYIPKDNSETTEIDVIFITKKGIFVIESKYYIGYIFGRDTDTNWVVSVYKGDGFLGRPITEKHSFFNPIKQNKGHIKWLKKYLNKDIQMFSCIIFSNDAELKSIDTSHSKDTVVCNRRRLNSYTLQVNRNYPDVLTNADIEDIYNKLKPLTKQDKSVKEKHINDIDKNKTICPYCKGNLVIRTANKGPNAGNKFYGCSNYPRCKFTKPL